MSDSDRYGVIGHPIEHSKSPVIHRLFAEQTGEDISYDAIDVAPETLSESIRQFADEGMKGLNVTVPHKREVAGLMDVLTERAEQAGAVNTVTLRDSGELEGDNTDGVGLVRDLLDNLGFKITDATILILGAGGATRGIVPPLLAEIPAQLVVANRTPEKAQMLAKDFAGLGNISACSFEDLEDQHFDLILNATSAGLDGDVPPFPSSILGPDTICYDLSYSMRDTPFVAWARTNGSPRAYQGWGMLVEQAAESFLIWRGIRPDTSAVLSRLR